MKTTQYVKQEKAIAVVDSGGIRQRWLWGLRLLRDPDAFSPGSSQLKPGRLDELVAAATADGLKLSEREIRYRLQCARASHRPITALTPNVTTTGRAHSPI